MSEQNPGGVPAESIPGYGAPEQPRSVGEALAAADQAAQAPVAPAAPQEGSTPTEQVAGPHEPAQAGQLPGQGGFVAPAPGQGEVTSGQVGLASAGTTDAVADRRARLQAELADLDREESEAAVKARDNASEDELCPTCGQLPPPAAPPTGHREIWCPDCGQKLADLPAGH